MKELKTWKEVVEAILAGEELECCLETSKVWIPCQYLPSIPINDLLSQHPNTYRIKPRTIMVGDIEVPEPVRDVSELGEGQAYYLPNLRRDSLYDVYTWNKDVIDFRLLKHGMIHKTKEAAILHTKALIKISGGSCD